MFSWFYTPKFTTEQSGRNIIPHVCAGCGAGWWGRYEDRKSTDAPKWCTCENKQ